MEVLESADAATIARSTPGRAYARTGGGAAIIAFQSARVAGRRKGASVGLPPPSVFSLPWARVGYPVALPPRIDEQVGQATDLHALVELINRAAGERGLGRGHSPWLAPLPKTIGLDTVASTPAPATAASHPLAVPYGLEDRPADQTQQPAVLDLVEGSHLVVAGAARSGRSTLLRTLAASLARSVSPDDVHLYGLDFGNGALLPLIRLPHCGAVVLRSEGERVERLFGRLADEVAARQEQLARQGFGDIAEQRAAAAPADRLPYLVVFLDRWEGFVATYPVESGSSLPATVARLVREGPGVGLRLVLAGDRSLLTDRITSLIEDRLVLRLTDREDYRLANINPRHVAESVGAGRALRAESGIEIQVALVDGPAGALDPSAQSQADAVRAIAATAVERWPPPPSNRPLRVDTMPSRITASEVADLVAAGRTSLPLPVPAGTLWTVIGVGGDELTAYAVDLAATGGLVVAGPARSGRSTTLAAVARGLAANGSNTVVVCPRPSPLTALAGVDGIEVLDGTPDPATLQAAVESASRSGRPVAIIVDDADVFARSDADETLRSLLRNQGPLRLAPVVAGPIEEMKTELRGVVAEARRGSAGILFSPSSSFDGDLIGLRLPKSFVNRTPPGRGCLAMAGEWLSVQVPVLD
ncbi:MAG: FtsK/SpoIIIE domain-containing protein [Actinomycetota bacterium]|nr:FtsK/SpoIIIE domain-containing protein [Actinomycetota bacterium]